MRAPPTFTGITRRRELGPFAHVRLTPSFHDPGSPPPRPQAGDVIPVTNGAGFQETLSVVQSLPDVLAVLHPKDRFRHLMRPLRPSEIGLTDSYPEGMGVTDWVFDG